MYSTKSLFQLGIAIAFTVLVSACAGVQTSTYSFNDTYRVNVPTKGSGCYDAAVLLDKTIGESMEISKKVLVAVDSTISEETKTTLKAQRNMHMGVFVSSGGEELLITLKEVSGNKTFATVATKTGFVGGAGQKAWSCQITDQIVAMASK